MPAPEKTKKETAADRLNENILNTLAELGGRAVADDEISFGSHFQLPELYRDNLRGAVDFLIKWIESNEEPHRFMREYPFKPWDGAVAVSRAFRRVFGTSVVQKNTFFEPAQFVNIPTSPTKEERVPYGSIVLPLFKGTLRIQGHEDSDGYETFMLAIDAPKKFQYHVEGLFRLVADELEKNSIYRGQAIDGAPMPNFLDLSGVDVAKIIYSQLTLRQLEANLWTPIRLPEECRAKGLDTKRAVLLQGPYGTGKTLAAMATAKYCDEINRTFVMCNPKDNNAFECLKTASLYQPSCLFVEDIDKLASTSDRDAMARLLDEFDGLKAKGRDIVIVLTTNRVGEIHKGMLRPGRMDAVIEITKLDKQGTQRLIETLFTPGEIDGLDFDKVHESMEDFTPAFSKEVCQKVKLYAITRHTERESLEKEIKRLEREELYEEMSAVQAQLDKIGNGNYTTEDFLAASDEMRIHYNLHTGAGELKAAPSVDTAIQEVVGQRLVEVLDHLPIVEPGDSDPTFELRPKNVKKGVK